MPENKTKITNINPEDILDAIEDDQKRQECFQILKLMKKITREKPKIWGDSLIGFGKYHYKYESGREGDFFLTGFSPRKQNISVYIMAGFDNFPEIMKNLGKYKTSVSCLYIKKLEDIEFKLLGELIEKSVEVMKKRYE